MEFELMKQQLNGEYREVFSAVWVYGIMKSVPEDTLTDRLTELYDILITAQTEGRDVRRVAGSDRERFCRDFFGDLTASERIKQLPERVYRWAWAIFVIELLVLVPAEGGEANGVSNVVPYLFGIGIGILFELLCRFVIVPLMVGKQNIKPETWNTVALASFAAMFISAVSIEGHIGAVLNVPSVPLVIGCGAYIALFAAARAVWRYKNYGTIFNERKRMLKDSYYKELGSADLETTVLKTWKRQYEKLSRRGKTDSEGFIEKVKKDERVNAAADKVYTLFCAAFYIVTVAVQASKSETVGETLVYAVISGVILYGLWRFFLRAFKMGAAARRKLIKECESLGQPLPEFIADRLAD